jgi:small neutral amino acid transporter SnatA (MarC family)
MTGVGAVVAIVLAAWNPALLAERTPAPAPRRWAGIATAAVAGLVLALAADPILRALDVSIPTFRTAAGTVIAITGARWLVGPPPREDDGDPLLLGVIDVATPAVAFGVVATSAASGWWVTAAAVAVTAAATAGLQAASPPAAAVRWMRRLVAGVALGLGVALVYTGIRAV